MAYPQDGEKKKPASKPAAGDAAAPVSSSTAGKEPAWRASVASSSIWRDAMPGPGGRGGVRGVIELALEGGPRDVALERSGWVVDAAGRAHEVELRDRDDERPWDGRLKARAKREVELSFEGGPALDAGAKARVRVRLLDGDGACRAVEGAVTKVQKVE